MVFYIHIYMLLFWNKTFLSLYNTLFHFSSFFYCYLKDFIYFCCKQEQIKCQHKYMSSICQGTWDCQNCPKAVDNAIIHTTHTGATINQPGSVKIISSFF